MDALTANDVSEDQDTFANVVSGTMSFVVLDKTFGGGRSGPGGGQYACVAVAASQVEKAPAMSGCMVVFVYSQ